MIEYICPTFDIRIGNNHVRKLVKLDVYASMERPIEVAKIEIDSLGIVPGSIEKDMPVKVALGYREKGLWPVFSGHLKDLSWRRNIVLECKSRMAELKGVIITQTFVDAAPDEIINYALGQAGVTNYVLGGSVLPPRHLFVCSGISVIDLFRLVIRTWDLKDWVFYYEPEDDGPLYIGPWADCPRAKTGEIIKFEYGKNLMDLKPAEKETGELESIMLPFVRHSNLIRITDERFWKRTETARVERIRYHQSRKKARVYIEWRLRAK